MPHGLRNGPAETDIPPSLRQTMIAEYVRRPADELSCMAAQIGESYSLPGVAVIASDSPVNNSGYRMIHEALRIQAQRARPQPNRYLI